MKRDGSGKKHQPPKKLKSKNIQRNTNLKNQQNQNTNKKR
jgi:hypothetical protein